MTTQTDQDEYAFRPVPGTAYACGYCHAITIGRVPHGTGIVCPSQAELHAALLAKTFAEQEQAEAARDAALKSQLSMLDMSEMMKGTQRMLGLGDGDDEEREQ